jgi:AbrB family looped-hinge helix DNA binding protein
MTALTVTAKGQITLRKEVLRHLGIAPGQKVEVQMLPNGRLELRAAKPTSSIDDFIGCLYRPGTKPPDDRGDQRAHGKSLGGRALRVTVDTNVVVRATIVDDPEQARLAADLLRSAELIAIPLSGAM